MSSAGQPTERVVEQRMRNRAIEALETLADGDEGVRGGGVGEYVEQFFDIIDDRAPWAWRTWSVFTAEEIAALVAVHDLLVAACDATPTIATSAETAASAEDDFIATGWPREIQPAAKTALDLMLGRGRFSEDVEEGEPSPSR